MCSWFYGPGAAGLFGGGILMMLPMLLFWGLILWGGIVLVRKLSQRKQDVRPLATTGAALDILKERYAKGEISRDEYESMKKDIE
ncbi:SHOCT domain-containing protein [Sporomusa sphaeroides DSM 2875]|uniref:SHOCT domain-containing protein n=1 Tax=Sporomusa sphaeroides TaxID=47679 RepID=UPI00202DCBFD|nr:SHOCT domain-containing protein [Sporomusa sphaeroides]MCM0757286.1 SHOCT domain-containing protein [Sporomusa sphaeroides DSM 2875]